MIFLAAIRSFPNGSARGPDKLKPLEGSSPRGEYSGGILPACPGSFCTLVLHGDVPAEVRPFFFGAALVALRKKSGGVEPIAVGVYNSIHRAGHT